MTKAIMTEVWDIGDWVCLFRDRVSQLPSVRPQELIPEQWQELKETIIEMRDNDGTATQQEVCKFLANYMDVLEKQRQEPCENEYIKIPKKALKYRTAGMVAYNAEWLKKNWQMEMDIVCGVKPCDDVVSRQAIKKLKRHNLVEGQFVSLYDIEQLPSVRPQEPQTGHWIMNRQLERRTCDNCNTEYRWSFYPHNFCPNCGARMVEPTCDTCEYNTAALMPCNECDDKSEYKPRESERINCKSTKCENCQNHNYCDFEPQESEE